MAGRRRRRKEFWRPKEVGQPQRGHFRPSPASADEAEAGQAREQEKTFRLRMRSAVSGDLLGAPGGGGIRLLEWDAKTATVRQMREAVASAVLATWKAPEGAERSRPNRLHWENVLLLAPEVRPPPSPSTLSQPKLPAAQEDNSLEEAADRPEPTSRTSGGSVCSESYRVATDVLLEDDGGKALLCDALHAHGAREVQSYTEMASAGPGAVFELKYFVRTFEPFASKNDVQKALALWLLEQADRRWMADVGDAGPGLTGATAAQRDALRLEQKDIEEKYGPLRIWDLSLLSDLSVLLRNSSAMARQHWSKVLPEEGWLGLGQRLYELEIFSADVSGWDVSGATDLSDMFCNCAEFDQNLAAWNVENVRDFSGMFAHCQKFDQDLASWNVGNGVDFSGMFRNCKNFDQPLAAWNVGNGVNFSDMFGKCEKFDQDLASWNVGNGVRFSSMFCGCRLFNRNLDPWDVAKAVTMREMFARCYAFNQPLSSWQVGRVEDFSNMFESCASFAQDVGSWNVNETAFLHGIFADCEAFDCDLSSWNISEPKRADMFQFCSDYSLFYSRFLSI